MNVSENILDVEFFLPGEAENQKGKLHLYEEDIILEFHENPFSTFDTRTIPVVYITDLKAQIKYTAVHCIWLRMSSEKTFYTPNELYKGEFIGDYSQINYSKLTAIITNLTSFLNPQIIQFSPNPEFLFSIRVLEGNNVMFEINNEYKILLRAYANVQSEKHELIVKTKSLLQIVPKTSKSRQELFSMFDSFLNFFTLFLSKLPNTQELEFESQDSNVELLGLSMIRNQTSQDVLLKFQEVENIESLLQNYFHARNELDIIINLWEICMKKLDSEIIFIHLTQSLETFHRSFFQKDDKERQKIKVEVETIFSCSQSKYEWTQLMRYYHLHKFTIEANKHIIFPGDIIKFLTSLRDSRNYYTHHNDKKQTVWSHFQLYAINRILRVWMRYLLLSFIGLKSDKNKYLANRESFHAVDIDIFRNPYSMRYKI